jgi:signal transduction histidine kinase
LEQAEGLMQAYVISGVFLGIAIGFWVGVIISLFVHISGRRSADYLLFSLLSIVLGFCSAGTCLSTIYGDGSNLTRWALGTGLTHSAWILAVVLNLHFALRYGSIKGQRTVAIAAYVVALILETLVLRGNWLNLSASHTISYIWLGIPVSTLWAPPERIASLFMGFAVVLQLAVTSIYGRAYVGGRREALPLFVGAALFLLTIVNDALLTSGLVRGISLVPFGFVVFCLALAFMFVRRYAITASELGRRYRELEANRRELRKSRADLAAVQGELGRKEQLAVIGEMAAVIAHEVRNPLAVISNAVASLRRDGISRHDHDVLLSILDEEAIRLNRLVSDLLSYARPVNIQRQRVVLFDLVQRTALLAGNRVDAKVIYSDNSVRGQVWGDPNLLRQVFDNIVENGLQAMGGVGTLNVSVKPIVQDGVEGFAVGVRDEGEGMDTQVRIRAKDPFFTTRPSGTGLGLAIVSRIVEAHGGKLLIESRAGEGSTVTVFLPIGSETLPPTSDPMRLVDTVPPKLGDDEPPVSIR